MSERLFGSSAIEEHFGVPAKWFDHVVVDIDGHIATIVFVFSKEEHRGYFRALIRSMEEQGYRVHIWSPVPRTKKIITQLGFHKSPVEGDIWLRRVGDDKLWRV